MNKFALFSLLAASVAVAVDVQDSATGESLSTSTLSSKQTEKVSQEPTVESEVESQEPEMKGIMIIEMVDPVELLEQMMMSFLEILSEDKEEEVEIVPTKTQPKIEEIESEVETEKVEEAISTMEEID